MTGVEPVPAVFQAAALPFELHPRPDPAVPMPYRGTHARKATVRRRRGRRRPRRVGGPRQKENAPETGVSGAGKNLIEDSSCSPGAPHVERSKPILGASCSTTTVIVA